MALSQRAVACNVDMKWQVATLLRKKSKQGRVAESFTNY